MTRKTTIRNKKLKRRIVEISYKLKLGHIGSCLTAVDIIDEIYKIKKPDEKFVLSAGHAGLALYCVIEKYFKHSPASIGIVDKSYECDAERMFNFQGVHPDRLTDLSGYIDYSSGSLGHGIGAAVGMALADRTKNVYCLLSDGEMAEGSASEALRIAYDLNLDNLYIYINCNGYGAYKEVDLVGRIPDRVAEYELVRTNMNDYPAWLQGQIAHYKVLNEQEYNELMELLK